MRGMIVMLAAILGLGLFLRWGGMITTFAHGGLGLMRLQLGELSSHGV